jgi:hypothetical protein
VLHRPITHRAPVLAWLPDLVAHQVFSAPSATPFRALQGAELFVVLEAGVYDRRWFGVGEVLVCSGEAQAEDATVLVARGFGRPRIGAVQGDRLIGDAGEPCHPARWRSAGRVAGKIDGLTCPRVAEMVERAQRSAPVRGEPGVGAAAGGRWGRSPAAQPSQLLLFRAA